MKDRSPRPVWVKGVVVPSGVGEALVLLDKQGEGCGWIEPQNVAYVPRFSGQDDDAAVMPPDQVAYTTHPLTDRD